MWIQRLENFELKEMKISSLILFLTTSFLGCNKIDVESIVYRHLNGKIGCPYCVAELSNGKKFNGGDIVKSDFLCYEIAKITVENGDTRNDLYATIAGRCDHHGDFIVQIQYYLSSKGKLKYIKLVQ